MNTLSTILSGFALLIALIAVSMAIYAVGVTREKSVRSISLRRMSKLEAEMTDIVDALATVRESMHKMRSRQNMKRLRNGDALDTDEPTEPEAWYRWARAKHLAPKQGK